MFLPLAALVFAKAAPLSGTGNNDASHRAERSRRAAPARDDDDDKTPFKASQGSAVAPPDAVDDKPIASAPLPAEAPRVDTDAQGDDEDDKAQPDSAIVVTARRLDAARTEIDASLGSTAYYLSNDAVENRPGGETGSVADILTQVPGVTLSNGRLTVRGSSGSQIRINNVIVPEAISDPADQLSSRLAQSTRLLTGTLPAQFGFAPAGVISVTTKNGLYSHGGQAEFFAGTDGMLEPAAEWAGSLRNTSLFASASVERERSRVSDRQGYAASDHRTSISGLGFADHVIDDADRVSLIFGGAHEHHEFGPTSVGPGSTALNSSYVIGTFQHSSPAFAIQGSLFAGASSNRASFSARSSERKASFGTQVDARRGFGTGHVLRFGLLATRSTSGERDDGNDAFKDARTPVAIYAQDEWSLGPSLTFNPGLRAEWLRRLGTRVTFEPRASLVWGRNHRFTAHIGYSRFAAISPLGSGSKATRVPDERDDYFDAGVQQKIGPLTMGADAYWRSAHNYIAENERVGTARTTAFAFRRARISGLELSAIFTKRATSAWANLSLASASARSIIGADSLFPPLVTAAAASHYVQLATSRPVTFSGGLVQRLGKFTASGDMIVSSGAVRTALVSEPNGSRNAPFAVAGLAVVYHAKFVALPADIRIDLTNLTNAHYSTGNPSNLEGGWARTARPRALTIGIEQAF